MSPPAMSEEDLRATLTSRSSDCEQRVCRLKDEVDRLWEVVAQERRERQENEVRLQRSLGCPPSAATAQACHEAARLETLAEEDLDEPEDGEWGSARRAGVAAPGAVKVLPPAPRNSTSPLRRRPSSELPRAAMGDAGGGEIDAACSAAAGVTAQCFGLRLDAFEVHVRARLEAVEDFMSGRNESLQSLLHQLKRTQEEVEALVRRDHEDLRAEWRAALEEEQKRGTERAQALGRTLGKELERSILSEAVTDLRADTSAVVRKEVAALRADLERRFEGVLAMKTNDPNEAKSRDSTPTASALHSADKPRELVLQQFGESVIHLEGTINNLLQNCEESRAEGASLRSDLEELRKKLQHLSSVELPDLSERLVVVQAQVTELQTQAGQSRPPFGSELRVKSCESNHACELRELDKSMPVVGRRITASAPELKPFVEGFADSQAESMRSGTASASFSTIAPVADNEEVRLDAAEEKERSPAWTAPVCTAPAVPTATPSSGSTAAPSPGSAVAQAPSSAAILLATPVTSPPPLHRGIAFESSVGKSPPQDHSSPKVSFQPVFAGSACMSTGTGGMPGTPIAPYLDRSLRVATPCAPPSRTLGARAMSPVSMSRSIGLEPMQTAVAPQHSPMLVHRQVHRSYSGPVLPQSDQALGSAVCILPPGLPSSLASSGGSMKLLPKQPPQAAQTQPALHPSMPQQGTAKPASAWPGQMVHSLV